jgi:hypothetical protein
MNNHRAYKKIKKQVRKWQLQDAQEQQDEQEQEEDVEKKHKVTPHKS